MKKITALAVALVTWLSLVSASFATGELNKPYDWYCMHTKNGEIPQCDSNMKFIEKHNGFYVDENASENDKVIYLTFDAGYENGNVEKIVDVMKEKGAVGAFFVLEHTVKANSELMKKIAANGNLICNHTSKHKDMTKMTDKEAFQSELELLEDTLKSETGLEMAHFYRPPEGRFNEQNLIWANEMGYKTVFWSFAYADWDNNNQPSCDAAYDKIISSTHNGEIILLHPTSATNAQIMGRLIDYWKSEGYRFGSLTELKCEA